MVPPEFDFKKEFQKSFGWPAWRRLFLLIGYIAWPDWIMISLLFFFALIWGRPSTPLTHLHELILRALFLLLGCGLLWLVWWSFINGPKFLSSFDRWLVVFGQMLIVIMLMITSLSEADRDFKIISAIVMLPSLIWGMYLTRALFIEGMKKSQSPK